MDCGHKSRKKVTAMFHESEEDGVVKQSETESVISDRWFDQNASMSLSLNCHPSFLTSDYQQLQRALDFSWWDVSLDNRFFSLLSLFGGSGFFPDRVSIFDGSRINPIEEAALVLDTSLDSAEKVCEEDFQAGVLTWLHVSLEDDTNNSPVTSYETANSSYECSFCEDSSFFESSCTSLSTHEDSSSSQLSDFDRTGFWVSLLDLQGEDFELLSDKELEFDVFQSDSPSPSSYIKRNFDIGFPNSGITSLSDENWNSDLPSEPVLEFENQFLSSTCEGDVEDINSNEPLFWPFESNSYCRPELEWNGLCTSPIESSIKNSSSERPCAARSIRLRLPERKAVPMPRRDVPERHTRKVIFRSGSTVGCKTSDGNNIARGRNIRPARLVNCTQGDVELHSCNLSMKRKPPKMKDNLPLIQQSFHLRRQLQSQDELQFHGEKNQKGKNCIKKTVVIEHYNDLKELNQPEVKSPGRDYNNFLLEEGSESNAEVPIETLVGLNEFNGHEGIDAEFDEGQFSLDGLLSEDPLTISLSDGSCSIAGDEHDTSFCTTISEQHHD